MLSYLLFVWFSSCGAVVPARACLMASAIRSAATVSFTSCTRNIRAPALAASTAQATLPYKRALSDTAPGEPDDSDDVEDAHSAACNTRPMKPLREAPTNTGYDEGGHTADS